MVGGLVLTGSSTMAPIAWVGSASPIDVNVLPPSVLIHTPPLAAPTKRRPGVVGSVAIALIRPVALKLPKSPFSIGKIAPPKFAKAFSIGCGPINFQVGLTPVGPTWGPKMLLGAASSWLASITCISVTAASYAPGGTPNCRPRRDNQYS